jgi:hypothetical protein
MVGYLAQALKQTSREATILLYAPALDPYLEKMTELADRVFCFYEMPKASAKGGGRQRRGWPESRGLWSVLVKRVQLLYSASKALSQA